jgi:hypothetical protein
MGSGRVAANGLGGLGRYNDGASRLKMVVNTVTSDVLSEAGVSSGL